MTQNLVSITFPPADIEAIDEMLAMLETKLGALITLSAAERRKAIKMGDKSEAFCRQTELVLRQNPGIVPGNFDLTGFQQDIAAPACNVCAPWRTGPTTPSWPSAATS